MTFYFLLLFNTYCHGQENPDNHPNTFFYSKVPKHDIDIILTRPTNRSVSLSVLTYQPKEASITIGKTKSKTSDTLKIKLSENEPKEIILQNLKPNSPYLPFFYKSAGSKQFKSLEPGYFHAQRRELFLQLAYK